MPTPSNPETRRMIAMKMLGIGYQQIATCFPYSWHVCRSAVNYWILIAMAEIQEKQSPAVLERRIVDELEPVNVYDACDLVMYLRDQARKRMEARDRR